MRINQIGWLNIEIYIQKGLEGFCTSLMDLTPSKNQ